MIKQKLEVVKTEDAAKTKYFAMIMNPFSKESGFLLSLSYDKEELFVSNL